MPYALIEQYRKLLNSSSLELFEFLSANPQSSSHNQLQSALRDQKEKWDSGSPLRVEDYLRQNPKWVSDQETVFALAVGEYFARADKGAPTDLSELDNRFPQLAERLRTRLQSISNGSGDSEPSVSLETKAFLFDSMTENVLHGRYKILNLIGEGTFGQVFHAVDLELQRQVAIKVPKPERFVQNEDVDFYLSEARTVAGLNHPNIVPVYDVGRTPENAVFIVSRFIDGMTLEQRLRTTIPPFEESARLIRLIAEALAHAHHRRLIHRDVKPANILIEESSGSPLVADFGLAMREEDYIRGLGIAGTPSYMSPEQARGEGHRLDGRSDVFSLGVILYESLTGQRPFRGSTTDEVLHQVLSVEPRTPRLLSADVPIELERICLKALRKRISDRYASAMAMAEDLQLWLAPKSAPSLAPETSLQVIPKGLRSFDADDACFFLELLPGPRDREGLPESIRFWKKRIEETDPEKTFSVGLIYGPSGCGKSSLVKAGLIPRLSKVVAAIYIEATPDETETRILRTLRKTFADLPTDLSLPETIAWLRRQGGAKIVIILDQFEQWLHSHRSEQETDLVAALRQCHGGQVQAIVMVRDDFAMAAARFMDAIEVPILQGENFATVDLFDVDHAKQVLIKFGSAFGKLPANSGILSADQQAFVSAVASGLSNDGKVVSVRLALFAEMIKGKPWTLQTLTDVGGTEGIGVNFLEDTFSSRNANPNHRLHEQAARAVLKSLLPEVSTDIKGHMRSHAELLADSGYESRPANFNTLLRILDGELRLITPTDPEGHTDSSRDSSLAARYYQLTHDYMVPSLRDWLTRKQQETRAGRAELKLAERTNLWTAKPENRYLPSIAEWGAIRTFTDRAKWTLPQRTVMRRAFQVHGLRWGLGLAVALMIAITTTQIFSSIERRNLAARMEIAVTSLSSSRGIILPPLKSFEEFPRKLLTEELQTQFAESTDSHKLPLAYALSHFGEVEVDFLVAEVEKTQADESANFLTALGHDQERAVVAIDAAAKGCDSRLPEAAAKVKANAATEPESNEPDEPVWRYKARLAMLSLQLGSTSLAADMCKLRPDPIQRTVFINECSSWCTDLLQLSQVVLSTDDSALRSAICLVVGGVPQRQVTAEQRKAWESILTHWHQHQHDTSTHSTSGWALRKWGIPLPIIAVGELQQSKEWLVNRVGITMLRIPAGHVLREDASTIEVMQEFFIGDREITVGQFQQFIDDPNYYPAEKPHNWHGFDPSVNITADHPAQNVNWPDAVLFCNWLSHRERLTSSYVRTGNKQKDEYGNETAQDIWQLDAKPNGYRLPTSAEWEYACRAGTSTNFSFGNSESMMSEYCRFMSRSSAICGSKRPNGWGLFDAHGNVWEWCLGWDGMEYFGRGGSWGYGSMYCMSASGSTFHPLNRIASSGGFRLALGSPAIEMPEKVK